MSRHTPGTQALASVLGGLLALALSACGSGGAMGPADVGHTANPAPVAQSADPPGAVPAGYVLTWSDEFSGEGLPDPKRWTYDTGRNRAGWHNNELQYYSANRLQNAEQQYGRLIITARKEALATEPDWGGQRYSSARLITRGKGEWTYGFFEVRAKVACGKGTWPAIWLLNSAGTWPAGGEMDIMEHIGHQPGRVFSSIHTTSGSGGSARGGATLLPDLCNNFHNFQLHWTAQRLRFGVDGVTHFEFKNPGTGSASWPFDKPQFLILNIAVGGDLGGAVDDNIFPVHMEIDHVRVYQLPP